MAIVNKISTPGECYIYDVETISFRMLCRWLDIVLNEMCFISFRTTLLAVEILFYYALRYTSFSIWTTLSVVVIVYQVTLAFVRVVAGWILSPPRPALGRPYGRG